MQVEHLSGSRIETYYQCQLKYHGIYDLGMRGETHPLTLMGSGVHYMFEHATNARIGVSKGSKDPMDYKDAAVKEYGVDEDLWPLMGQLVENGIGWGYFRMVSKTVGCEVGLDFELSDGTKVVGYIDRLDVDYPTADVIDLKTQKREFDDTELAKKWQGRIYNIGARRLYPNITGKVSASFWVLRHRVQRVWFTADNGKSDEQELMRIADEIRGCKEPKPSPSGLCPWCPMYGKCKASRQGVKARFKHRRT